MRSTAFTQFLLLVCALLTYDTLAQKVESTASDEHISVEYQLVAHRGGIVEGLFDEYDPRSIDAAIDSGYWMLEIDVRPTADHDLIVHHDESLERIYGIDKSASELTLKELKGLKAKNGGYPPLTFEDIARRCQGKVRIMLDLKPENPDPWFYQKIEDILIKYQLLEESFFIDHAVQPYFKGGKFGFRMSEVNLIQEKLEQGEDVAAHYYLFDHGNRINAEIARWCQKNHIEICASVNVGHYKLEDDLTGAERDIEYLKKCGVRIFQIDSQYGKFF